MCPAGPAPACGRRGWGFPNNATLLRRTGADQIADHDEASGDADTNVQRLLRGEPADRVDDREPGAHRPLGLRGALDHGLRSPSRCRRGGQIIDRAQHALAMPEQYAEFLEVRLGQIGQGFEVDRVVAKDWLVLLQTQALQPSADTQGLPPLSTTGFRCDTIAVR
jgi:hypothetical protein